MKQKITCEHIELAIMAEFNFRQNLIVPNISNMMDLVAFETDMLIISKSGYATGFEIKVSKADLKADFKKPQHRKLKELSNFGNTGMERYFGKFKYFYYAVPLDLKEIALELIPDFCGLYTFDQDYTPRQKTSFKKEREAKKLFDYCWPTKDITQVARLGCMRLYRLKGDNLARRNQVLHLRKEIADLKKTIK